MRSNSRIRQHIWKGPDQLCLISIVSPYVVYCHLQRQVLPLIVQIKHRNVVVAAHAIHKHGWLMLMILDRQPVRACSLSEVSYRGVNQAVGLNHEAHLLVQIPKQTQCRTSGCLLSSGLSENTESNNNNNLSTNNICLDLRFKNVAIKILELT